MKNLIINLKNLSKFCFIGAITYISIYAFTSITNFFAPTNVINDITDFSANKVVKYLESTDEPYLIIESNGGSVFAGNSIIRAMEGKLVTCEVRKAISMGFAIMTYCDKIILSANADIMQHMVHAGEGREALDKQMELPDFPQESKNTIKHLDNLHKKQALRILGITEAQYDKNVKYGWWISPRELMDMIKYTDKTTITYK